MASVAAKKVLPARAKAINPRGYIHLPHNLGEQLADSVANGMGSWKFIIIQSTIVGLWIVLNLLAFAKHWDPYPFILLNLLFSTQAAYAAPVIMMSQNRQAQKDRIRDDHEADEVDLLYKINEQQLEILALLRRELCPDPSGEAADSASADQSAPLAKAARKDSTSTRRRR